MIIRYCDTIGKWQKRHNNTLFHHIRTFYSSLGSLIVCKNCHNKLFDTISDYHCTNPTVVVGNNTTSVWRHHFSVGQTVIIRYCDTIGKWQKRHNNTLFHHIRTFYSSLGSLIVCKNCHNKLFDTISDYHCTNPTVVVGNNTTSVWRHHFSVGQTAMGFILSTRSNKSLNKYTFRLPLNGWWRDAPKAAPTS